MHSGNKREKNVLVLFANRITLNSNKNKMAVKQVPSIEQRP